MWIQDVSWNLIIRVDGQWEDQMIIDDILDNKFKDFYHQLRCELSRLNGTADKDICDEPEVEEHQEHVNDYWLYNKNTHSYNWLNKPRGFDLNKLRGFVV